MLLIKYSHWKIVNFSFCLVFCTITAFRPSKIYLVGMMGSGKTTVGKDLSKVLNWRFIDTDELIESTMGCSIASIFEKFGESHFRAIESVVLQSTVNADHTVISTGGGVVLRRENWCVIRSGSSVFLDVSPIELLARIEGESYTRPLLSGDDVLQKLQKLDLERRPLYSQADISFKVPPGCPSKDIAAQLASKLLQSSEIDEITIHKVI